MTMRIRPFAFAFSILLYAQASVAQFSGITGIGDGINYEYYGTITTALNEIRPFGIYATSIQVYIDFWQAGFTSGVDLTSATLYYKVNSSTFGTANDASWTQVPGTISAVPSSNDDRATFTLTGIAPGTDIMFYIRAQTNTGGFRDGYAYPGQSSWSTTAPSSQAQTYKIRFNKAAAYNTIRIDGQSHDWQATSQIALRSTASIGRTLDIMWDDTYIYFLINEGFSALAGDRIHFGFDRNPGAGGNANGTRASFSGASFPENYRPDIIFRARGTGLGTWTNDRGDADGSNGWTYTDDIGNPTSDMWSVSGTDIALLEVRIARSAIGSFDSLGVFVWLSNSSDNLYDSFPHGNPQSNGLMPIQIGFPNLNDGTVPRDDGYFDGQYNHTSSFNIFGIKRYRNLRISSPTGVEIGISNSIDSLTVTGDLRIDANATLRPNAVQTITMKGAPGNIINNGFMNASPGFMNDLNFVIDSVITLSGTSPVDVFNLTVNAGDTLKVTGTNLRTGNTGTITVNGTIEFGETNIVQSWGGTANFALNSGATLITANQNGVNGTANGDSSTFNGTIRVGGTVTYHNNATYIFSRNGNQTVGFLQRGNLPAISQANRLATLTRPTARTVTLEGDFPLTAALSQPALNVGANTTLDIGSFDLTANGNLLGSGTISGAGKVIVNATPSAIQIGGLTFNTNLSLQDNDGATLIADASVTSSGSLTLGSNVKLTLQSGVTLSLNNAPLTISNPETEHIITQTNARLRRSVGASDTTLFPVATSAFYFPLTVSTNASVIGGDVAVGVDGTNPASGRMGDGTFAVQTIYHVQAPSFDFGSGTVSLNFGWLTGAEGTNFDSTKSFPARWTSSMWESYRTNSGLTRDNSSTVKQVSITGLTVLEGEWAVFAADDDSPLPVSLTDFTARATPRGIELWWRTATEQENLGFIVLRNGEEIASYATHHTLRGNGTTLTESQYTFLDDAVEVGRTYTYRLRSVDFSGTIHDYELTAIATAIEKIASFELFQNYPNPFNPTTVIRYQLPVKSEVKLELFDVLGRKLATLVSATQDAGSYTVSVSASALNLSSGVYLYRLTAGTFMDTKKMLFVK
jgi:hypothetical protein